MTEFSLRDNLDSNDPAEYVVVRSGLEYGRWYRLDAAQEKARQVAASALVQRRDAVVEVFLDHPGNPRHGDCMFWVDVSTGDNA